MPSRTSTFSRTPPPLPSPASLPFPGNLIRGCSDCGLRAGCHAPVPGDGPTPARVMLVGEAPGRQEDEWGYRPFVGQAGKYLDSLLFQVSLARELIYVTNVLHCRPPNNRTPKLDEVQSCSQWLDIELGLVQPEIIMALGGTAIRRFLGNDAGTVEHLHGKPIELDGRIILPAYHPAAALRNTALLRQCQEDFNVLRGLVKGVSHREYHVVDEYPDPDYDYVVADTPDLLRQMRDEIEDTGYYAVDTETSRGELWSAQLSAQPGTAWFIPVGSTTGHVDLTGYRATAIVHNYLFDIQYLKLNRFLDTMTMAYLVGAVQGLKELASRLCGIDMKNYREIVRPGQQKLSLEYLNKVAAAELWPDPPSIEETKWDNKKGELVTKVKRPWHIARKANRILSDYAADPGTDLWARWQSVPEEERAVITTIEDNSPGPMPESSLADIPFHDAVQYSCRDADATLRVYLRLKKTISDMGLDFILDMDLGILPMVHSMMQNGIAVDLDHFRDLSEQYGTKMQVKSTELADLVGHAFNPNSGPQVAAVVYGELGYKPTSLTPTGLVSTDDAELKKTGHPVAKGVIEYRRLSKMKGTYSDNIIQYATFDEWGVPRVHTTIKTTRTETGRLSSAEPMNFQNIPTRSKEGRLIKNGFVAPPGKRLGEGDLGQIEMCVQAHMANCRGLIDIFLRGLDPHTLTASTLFGVSYEEAKEDKYRYPTKRANFGIIYMIGAEGLSAQITEYIADLEMDGELVSVEPWSEQDCEKFIADWYKLYPEVRDYQMEMAAMARRYGYVRDMFGRIRYVPEVSCPIRHVQESGLRMAANMPVQAGAAGLLKIAMGNLWTEQPQTPWVDMRWLMAIHDSLLLELPDDDDYVRGCLNWIGDGMRNAVKLRVPVKVDFKVGYSWGELKELETK
ncbi:MAG: DNA polymerase [Candidatus Bathyanammoxibius sp.]